MSSAEALVRSMRPKQWTKNLVVFAPLIFAGELTDAANVARVVAAFAVLCATSGGIYLLNDVRDAASDALHREKRSRPVASGQLAPTTALAVSGLVVPLALLGAFVLSRQFAAVVLGYVLLQSAYALRLRFVVILDVMTISAGFVLRAVSGAVVIDVPSSPWLVLCAALLALFLALAKRRHEIVVLGEKAAEHRAALADYSPAFIDEMVSAITSATIVSYALYTFFSAEGDAHPYLMLTVPFVTYGVFRYLYLMHKENLGGSPEDVLLTDMPLMVSIALWLASAIAILYAT